MSHKVEVLGPGCTRCRETFRVVQHVVDGGSLASEFDVVKNESIDRMIELGVTSTPAIAVDGRIVLTGHVPKADEVRRILGVS